ncbi:MAG: DUF2953 domain-containing protein [Lachnospiraceae bacterium]|nr:DUF2953 domain-containing protein [Lachnospiraceae bacterium]
MGLLILQVLKWILWIILCLLLGIVVLSLLVLLVPVRYRIEGEYHEKAEDISGRVSWLLSLVQFSFVYQEGLKKRFRLLGITLYDSDRPQKASKKKRKSRKASGNGIADPNREAAKEEEANSERKDLRKEAVSDEADSMEKPELSKSDSIAEEPVKAFTEPPGRTKGGLESLWNKVKEIWQKLQNLIHQLKLLWKSCGDKAELVRHYRDIWQRESTQVTWQKARKRIGRALKPTLPRKWLLTGNIGFEDPSLTGQLMAGVGILYPIHGGHLQIIPDFERSHLEVKGYAKGKIVLGVVLYHLLILILDKNCMAFLKWILQGTARDNQKENEDNNMQEVTHDRQ